ncbi:hypothetical protein VPFG_00204 [Vibrio phage nt-1]|uniref:Uncharacterized protein n=1 Tax=Vibrio phage nt-1 TaxID=115992 RepID=R9TFF8_9CAUD|nr:hypothetical protein VPFG_00204 [Vibrio phage nt-1]AGN30204.1 hypothetical protein VPFG_00204 [Vibrio phage nt-1]
MKLKNLFDNAVILAQEAKSKPKITASVLLAVLALGYGAYTRVPAIASCTWTAVIDQSVPWDLWRHNMWNNNCQYYNGTRWIDLKKVMDVGAGNAEELEDLAQ